MSLGLDSPRRNATRRVLRRRAWLSSPDAVHRDEQESLLPLPRVSAPTPTQTPSFGLSPEDLPVMDATTVLPNPWKIQKPTIHETPQANRAINEAGAQDVIDRSPATEESRFDCRPFLDDNGNRTNWVGIMKVSESIVHPQRRQPVRGSGMIRECRLQSC